MSVGSRVAGGILLAVGALVMLPIVTMLAITIVWCIVALVAA